MMMMFVCAIGLLLLACIADVWTTLRGLRHGLVERNMVVRWATNWPWLLWVVKAAFLAIAVRQLYSLYCLFPGFAVGATLVCAWLTAFVALRNVRLTAVVRDDR